MSHGSPDARHCKRGYPANPCVPTDRCRIPFLVAPPVNPSPFCKVRFGGEACDQSCPCYKPEDCDLIFLTLGGEYYECPDTHRTCTRSECCPTGEKPSVDQAIQAPKSDLKNNANAGLKATGYERINQNREKLPDTMDNTFKITLVNRDANWNAARIPENAKVWAVNGYPGARIHLVRGRIYKFIVNGDGEHGFYFSTDQMGPGKTFGTKDGAPIEGTQIVKSGIVTLKVDDNFPDTFYYHTDKNAFCGGQILVHSD